MSPTKRSYAKTPSIGEVPKLIQTQLDSFRWFQEQGLRELFQEISPIPSPAATHLELHFISYEFRQPKYSDQRCIEQGITYSAPLYVKTQLIVKDSGEIKEQEVFIGDFPLMTTNATFIINGTERVVVSQLTRSPGVYFTLETDVASGRELCFAKLVFSRGGWLEFETNSKDVISVKIDGKRRVSATTLLRAIGYGSDEKLVELLQDVDPSPEHSFIKSTIERDPLIRGEAEALLEIYRRLRPGNPPIIESARSLIGNLFFDSCHYSLGEVGRYKLNKRLGLDGIIPLTRHGLTKEDLVEIVRCIIKVSKGEDSPDDIDHLSNRQLRPVGKLIQNQFRIGLHRLEQTVKERMSSLVDIEKAIPSALINTRPIVTALREFVATSQLSQFMDQTNPLAELTHKRRISALGPGGLSRERAGFEVRDVHYSHYGRICPIETPEGPNIGLIGSLATYSSINKYGFIETPCRRVLREVESNYAELLGRTLRETVTDDAGDIIAEAGAEITPEIGWQISNLPKRLVKVMPFVSHQIISLSADEEKKYTIAQATTPIKPNGQFIEDKVDVRHGGDFFKEAVGKIDFMDISPRQIVGASASLIPFLEHDDANRALMGANMQRQAVPLLRSESPLIGTGMEEVVARDSGQVLFAPEDGEVISASGREIVLRDSKNEVHAFPLSQFVRTNQGTCLNKRSMVSKGEKVKRGQVLADNLATDQGELALGRNVLCAFMSWDGYNFEDAIIISESLVREGKFTSIHIEKYEIEAQATKLGPEEITRDIPDVGEESLRNLDEQGVIRIGAEVESGDILAGKITPKGEVELTAEEKLLRAIFGEKAHEVKDSSLYLPHGERGTVIRVKVSSREHHDELPNGVERRVEVWVARQREINVGDKLAGRHGNKGVIARILPVEDMPFLSDGTPIDILLDPIGVPSRMNLGQILETHLGWAARILGFKAACPVFEGASDIEIEDALAQAWILERAGAIDPLWNSQDSSPPHLEVAKAYLNKQGYDGEQIFSDGAPGKAKLVCLRLWLNDLGVEAKSDGEVMDWVERVQKEQKNCPPIYGKTTLYDGRTGEPFDQAVTVGYIYMMKLIHLVEDKVHARSIGPYSLITQQPLGGKAQFGGQRFGEMEVWALEAYGAANLLQEMLTIKSDDIVGRAKAYEAIAKGENISPPGLPQSFNVLAKELQSLGLAVELIREE